ncbi:hypothetical protein RNQ85_25720, partial [Escherichia coli]|nr:hypothetical protein [Escherichia coli]
MKWIVIDTVIQPTCGISFSAIWGDMKMIIWYQPTIFLTPGSIFTPVKGNDSNLLIVFYVQIMPDDLVMQLHR